MKAGRFKARATAWKFGKSGQKGTHCIAINFELVDPPFEGETITAYCYFTPKTNERTLQSLRYCGWSCDDLTVLTGMGTQLVELDIQPERDQSGREMLRVAWINQVGGGVAMKKENELNAAEVRQLAASMKRLASSIARTPGPSASTAPPASTASTAPPDDDDNGYGPPPNIDEFF